MNKDMGKNGSGSWFARFARAISHASGHPITFMVAVLVIIVWGVTGPIFGFSDTWQLIINTGTTIVTFLMVFLIQNTQNRDGEAVQVKLDELIRVTKGAHNALLGLEDLDDKELQKVRATYQRIASEARDSVQRGQKDTDAPDVQE